MRSYSERRVFSGEEQALLREATQLVARLPDDNDLRCHELARVIGELLRLPVQDGHYKLVEHSWLWARREKPYTSILDVYCVGSLPMVRLLDTAFMLPHLQTSERSQGVYIPGEERTDIDYEKVARLVFFLRSYGD